jgi:hypothetical protein
MEKENTNHRKQSYFKTISAGQARFGKFKEVYRRGDLQNLQSKICYCP